MRLNPEFLDAVEPPRLKSWLIIGKVAGQEPLTHEFEVIFLSFISLESGRVFCTQNRVGRPFPHAASAARISDDPTIRLWNNSVSDWPKAGGVHAAVVSC